MARVRQRNDDYVKLSIFYYIGNRLSINIMITSILMDNYEDNYKCHNNIFLFSILFVRFLSMFNSSALVAPPNISIVKYG